ncbi:MAG: hypothetical protein ACT4N2_00865 [Hyphomicrobium sp.]
MALWCLTLVVPLALFADLVLIFYGQPAEGEMRRLGFLDQVAAYGVYVLGIPVAIVLYASFTRFTLAKRIRNAIDRWMMPIAYTASGLLLLFACLMWLRGEPQPAVTGAPGEVRGEDS